ncbi:acyl carrier protein [Latilactobacillus curvatus]|uniref:Acyl carrier protein n=1 Tax=Latilactobacillus curvatus TaxID=28038 RepID=A0A0B2XKM3_LATCU|nr:acyl carrier protein [Latilactobacillus curvatus]MDT3394825.1 acyl carrier protein [Bacillota bacterium]ANJ69484.1 acyl carrier protein [Latilactobacillus curvatus]ANY13724.1 acyl carrier protein [Latilactobacillus curvatus]AOO75382.1 acyl carrier protein [Latilactobacillus curvatus]ASN60028.1 acyl carrier protein [Latilactobacillus curvatus]
MTKAEILKKVQAVIAEQLDVEESQVVPTANIREDLDADSLDIFEVMNQLEDDLEVKLDPDESIVTVQNVVDYIDQTMAK